MCAKEASIPSQGRGHVPRFAVVAGANTAERNPYWWLCCALYVIGCTNASLMTIPDELPAYPRQRLDAVVCAPEPREEQVPYNVLFVIDTSYSNSWNDAGCKRGNAVMRLIEAHANTPNVRFGVITFSDTPRVQTLGFTRDRLQLEGAVDNICDAQGGTNYSDTLWEAHGFLATHLATLGADERSRSHILVKWISDGQPTVANTSASALVPFASAMVEAFVDDVAEITVDTVYLGGVEPGTTAEEAATASALLLQIAEAGGGTFTDVPAGGDVSFDVDPMPLVTRFFFRTAVVSNRHARLGPVADSDMDGLVDEIDPDPTDPDTDDDGYRDGIETLVTLDATVPNGGCDGEFVADAGDTDGDGLSDCEEILLGSELGNPDSNGDGILDSHAVMQGASAVTGEAFLDTDLDGMADRFEVMGHLPPREPTAEEDVALWGYVYDGVDGPAKEQGSDDRQSVDDEGETESDPETECYSFSVRNLWMVETLAHGDQPVGGNLFEVTAHFESDEAMPVHILRRARIRARFRMPDLQEPPTGRFRLDDSHFETLGIPDE